MSRSLILGILSNKLVKVMGSEEMHDLIVIGAGPTGLACGLFALRHGLSVLLIEKGTVVESIVNYPHGMRFFSTTDKLSLGGLPFTSTEFRPSRAEAITYYRGVADACDIPMLLGVEALSCEKDEDCFRVETSDGCYRARRVVLATGYFDHVNRLGVPGEDLPHVSHYYREPYRWFRKQVVVVGGRNSAVETALELYRTGASVTVVHRGEELGNRIKYWLRPDFDNRVAAGEIGLRLNSVLERITGTEVILRDTKSGVEEGIPADGVLAMIGYRPDARLFERFGITYDRETLVPTHDTETFETNVKNLYLAGSVACGCKTWEIFIENGRVHAEQVVARIAEDLHSTVSEV